MYGRPSYDRGDRELLRRGRFRPCGRQTQDPDKYESPSENHRTRCLHERWDSREMRRQGEIEKVGKPILLPYPPTEMNYREGWAESRTPVNVGFLKGEAKWRCPCANRDESPLTATTRCTQKGVTLERSRILAMQIGSLSSAGIPLLSVGALVPRSS